MFLIRHRPGTRSSDVSSVAASGLQLPSYVSGICCLCCLTEAAGWGGTTKSKRAWWEGGPQTMPHRTVALQYLHKVWGTPSLLESFSHSAISSDGLNRLWHRWLIWHPTFYVTATLNERPRTALHLPCTTVSAEQPVDARGKVVNHDSNLVLLNLQWTALLTSQCPQSGLNISGMVGLLLLSFNPIRGTFRNGAVRTSDVRTSTDTPG
jgi:hypothetical protein